MNYERHEDFCINCGNELFSEEEKKRGICDTCYLSGNVEGVEDEE